MFQGVLLLFPSVRARETGGEACPLRSSHDILAMIEDCSITPRRRNSDSFVNSLDENRSRSGSRFAHPSDLSIMLHNFVVGAVHAPRIVDDHIAKGEATLYQAYPHLSDAICSFFRGVNGFIKQLQHPRLDPIRVDQAIGPDQRDRPTLADMGWTPDRQATVAPEIFDENVADGRKSKEHVGGGSSTFSKRLGSEQPFGCERERCSVEEDADCDEGVHQPLGSPRNSDGASSPFCESLSDFTEISAVNSSALSETDIYESPSTDDAASNDKHSGSPTNDEVLHRLAQNKQINQQSIASQDDHDSPECGGQSLDQSRNTFRQGAEAQPTCRSAKNKRRAKGGNPVSKRTKLSSSKSYLSRDRAAEKQSQALDPTRVPGLSLADIPTLPQGTIQPHTVYAMLQKHCPKSAHEDILFLTKLFFSLGSPSAVVHLKNAVLMMRRQTASQTQEDRSQTAHISHYLDQVELCAPLIRRYGLIHLRQRRGELEMWHQNQNGTRRSSRKRKQVKDGQSGLVQNDEDVDLTTTKVGVAALNDLVLECYPYLHLPVAESPDPQDDEFWQKKAQTQYRLGAARKYALLQNAISTGAVAMIPLEGISVSR